MAGTQTGGLAAARTNKTVHGGDFYVRIGRKGGANGTGHKFAHGKISPSAAGKLGGRPKKNAQVYKEFQEGFSGPSWKDKVIRRLK